jgi:transposase
MTRDDLARMSRDELIDKVLADNARLQQMQAEIEALKLKLEKNKKPPTNSSNSSQPPSRDQKVNQPKDKRKRHRHGPPVGHVKYERKMVAKPDHIVEVKPLVCEHCQSDLSAENGELVDVNQITELPEAKAEVIEVRQIEVACPCCGQKQTSEPPEGLEMERTFGSRLQSTVVYYRQQQHMSYERTQKALSDLHGVKLCEGAIDRITRRAGQRAGEQTQPIREKIRQSEVIHCDETICRVDSQNWYQWAFSSAKAVLHVVRFDRSVDVIKEVMAGHEVDVWVSDCYKVQMKSPSRAHQLCMAHQLRNLQAVVDQYPSAFWPKAMQALFRAAVHLHNQRNALSPPAFQAQTQRLERICNQLLKRPGKSPDEKRLLKRYTNYRDCLFVFLHRTDVSPTNNVSERYLRPSVIHRKVIGCFRSGWGAHAYADIASVIDTAALTGSSPFETIQELFGRPALPLPTMV